jgi:hypothetical protein
VEKPPSAPGPGIQAGKFIHGDKITLLIPARNEAQRITDCLTGAA